MQGWKGGGSFVLHFFQNWHNHVKFRSLCWVFIHAYLHQLANMWWYARRDCGPQTFQGHLRVKTDKRFREKSKKKPHSLQSTNQFSFDYKNKEIMLTFMPISMLDRSANGTSLVTSSQSRMAKLHMSAERRLISSGFFCRAAIHKNQPVRAKGHREVCCLCVHHFW